MKKFDADAMGERLLRKLAGGTSRRSMLSRLGAALVAAPAFPLLPVSRAEAAKPDRSPEGKTGFARNAQTKDEFRWFTIDKATLEQISFFGSKDNLLTKCINTAINRHCLTCR